MYVLYKARLVARGFEESNLIDIRKDSPTCCKENFRLLQAIAVTNKWKVHSLDIKSAFLQGNEIDCEVYLKPPSEAGMNSLWKLNISVYGLCDAPRAWYLSLKSVLEKGGAKKSKFDDAVFFLYDNNRLQGILCAHVVIYAHVVFNVISLQGNEIDCEVYLKPPSEAGTNSLWKLNISVYGLCDAPRAWYLSLKSVLEKGGAKKSKFDDAVFFLYDNNRLQGILCAHVDDFCWVGTEQFEVRIIKLIKQSFQISLEELETFTYLGLNVQQTCNYIKIDQDSYIKEFKEVVISQERRKDN